MTRAPHRDHYIEPTTNHNTATVIDEAIKSLGTLTTLNWLGDQGIMLHLPSASPPKSNNASPKPSPKPATNTTPGHKSETSSAPPEPAPGNATHTPNPHPPTPTTNLTKPESGAKTDCRDGAKSDERTQTLRSPLGSGCGGG